MQNILTQKLHEYIKLSNPELLIGLEEEGNVTAYLSDKVTAVKDFQDSLMKEAKPTYLIEEVLINEITAELRPSKFNYIKTILAEEFETVHQEFFRSGILTYEVINLFECCIPVFETLGFNEENEDEPYIRYAIVGAIEEHLHNKL